MNKKNTRMCVVCRLREEKKNLIRIVADGESIKVDEFQKENKRAMYICSKEECLKKLLKKKNLETMVRASLKDSIVKDENIRKTLENLRRG